MRSREHSGCQPHARLRRAADSLSFSAFVSRGKVCFRFDFDGLGARFLEESLRGISSPDSRANVRGRSPNPAAGEAQARLRASFQDGQDVNRNLQARPDD